MALLALSACATQPTTAPDAAAIATAKPLLAPSGKLKIGVYNGSPTSMVRNPKTGEAKGLTLEMGRSLAAKLGVGVEIREYPRLAQVIDALKVGEVDFTITNASPARALEIDFTPTLVSLALDHIVMPGSRVKTVADVDQPGVRLGVSQGIDAFETNRAMLFELSDQVPGSRVLDGRWGLEHLAIGVPKKREAAMPYLREFAEQASRTGLVASANSHC
jgi:polar amino acid transport system substrate-binding protein